METQRRKILEKAVHDCFKEMYAKSQPSADYDKLVEDYRNGIIGKDERVYERHYLSKDEFEYIMQKYLDAYNITPHWKDDVEVVEKYLKDGGLKDKYIKASGSFDEGNYEPGYRSAENVPPLKELIKDYLYKNREKDNFDKMSEDISNIVLDTINECKKFYKFDREESSFKFSVCLGASPTCNPETVKKYWKEKDGLDISIEERNPKLFWYYDNGYTDDDLAEEFEWLGDDWKEKLNQEWKEEIHKKEEEAKKRMEELQKKINEDKENNA